MQLDNCQNFNDFRRFAKRRLPAPIFDYIDGAADDEATHRRNTQAFENCDLVPNVLRGVENVDLSVTVMGQKLALPIYCSPTALQRLFHHQGERAVAAAAAKYRTMFGASSLGTVSLEELRKAYDTPQIDRNRPRAGSRVCNKSVLRTRGANSGSRWGRSVQRSEIGNQVGTLDLVGNSGKWHARAGDESLWIGKEGVERGLIPGDVRVA
jgi:hypothetical protein